MFNILFRFFLGQHNEGLPQSKHIKTESDRDRGYLPRILIDTIKNSEWRNVIQLNNRNEVKKDLLYKPKHCFFNEISVFGKVADLTKSLTFSTNWSKSTILTLFLRKNWGKFWTSDIFRLSKNYISLIKKSHFKNMNCFVSWKLNRVSAYSFIWVSSTKRAIQKHFARNTWLCNLYQKGL